MNCERKCDNAFIFHSRFLVVLKMKINNTEVRIENLKKDRPQCLFYGLI